MTISSAGSRDVREQRDAIEAIRAKHQQQGDQDVLRLLEALDAAMEPAPTRDHLRTLLNRQWLPIPEAGLLDESHPIVSAAFLVCTTAESEDMQMAVATYWAAGWKWREANLGVALPWTPTHYMPASAAIEFMPQPTVSAPPAP